MKRKNIKNIYDFGWNSAMNQSKTPAQYHECIDERARFSINKKNLVHSRAPCGLSHLQKVGPKRACIDGNVITPKHCVCVNFDEAKQGKIKQGSAKRWNVTRQWCCASDKGRTLTFYATKTNHLITWDKQVLRFTINWIPMNAIFIILISLLFCSRCAQW